MRIFSIFSRFSNAANNLVQNAQAITCFGSSAFQNHYGINKQNITALLTVFLQHQNTGRNRRAIENIGWVDQ